MKYPPQQCIRVKESEVDGSDCELMNEEEQANKRRYKQRRKNKMKRMVEEQSDTVFVIEM